MSFTTGDPVIGDTLNLGRNTYLAADASAPVGRNLLKPTILASNQWRILRFTLASDFLEAAKSGEPAESERLLPIDFGRDDEVWSRSTQSIL